MDYHELHKMRVADLRELAKEKTSLTGVSGLHKEDLVDRLADALGIEKPHKVAVLSGKAEIKQRLRKFKADRQAAIESKDREQMLVARKELKKIRRQLQHAAKEALVHS
ncbi:MAG: hypothetical protein R3E97_19695 [Candidatus Eisenbacteria bacterium]